MRKINKPSLVPEKLVQVQKEIAAELFTKKNSFRWQPQHYNTPIKEELKTLYHNKCAFCETLLTDRKNAENQFTIEHFRYKAHYYWLGNEWTNLFPLCSVCNNKKSDILPTSAQKISNPPFDVHGNLLREKCLATYEELLDEKPLYIHPEIEDGKNYFYFDKNGKIQSKPNLLKYQNDQAIEMQSKFLNMSIFEEKRKKVIIDFQNDLRNDVIDFLKETQTEQPTEREVKLAFQSFFRRLWQRQAAEAEFSLLGYSMLNQFDLFFLFEYEGDVKALVQYAFQLFIKSTIDSSYQ